MPDPSAAADRQPGTPGSHPRRPVTLYDALGLTPETATPGAIRAASQRLMTLYHSDKGPRRAGETTDLPDDWCDPWWRPDLCEAILRARDTLLDPVRRKRYDRQLDAARRRRQTAGPAAAAPPPPAASGPDDIPIDLHATDPAPDDGQPPPRPGKQRGRRRGSPLDRVLEGLADVALNAGQEAGKRAVDAFTRRITR